MSNCDCYPEEEEPPDEEPVEEECPICEAETLGNVTVTVYDPGEEDTDWGLIALLAFACFLFVLLIVIVLSHGHAHHVVPCVVPKTTTTTTIPHITTSTLPFTK
jgi:hypothetical protein